MQSKAGALVNCTGVYRVVHHGHRAPHEAILQTGEFFPICGRCGSAVLFELAVDMTESDETEHIGYDPDFIDSVLTRLAKAG